MARTKKIQFNVTHAEYEILKKAAQEKGISMAEVLRDHIKSLETRG